MNKKIIFVTTLLPYPPDMGGKIKTLSTLRQLIQKDDVYLFSFVDKKEDLKHEKAMLKLGIKKCYTVVHPVIAEKHRLVQFKILLNSLLTAKPYSVYKYYSSEMVDIINKILKENKVDILWIDHTIQTQYLPEDFTGIKILETHNFKTNFFKTMFFADNKIFWKLFSFYEWMKFIFYEPKELKKFDLVYAVSEKEKKELNKYSKNVKMLVPLIPTTGNKAKIKYRKLFFVGLLTWYPNKQGIEWFTKNVFGWLKNEIPDITLDIVGDYSPKWQKPVLDGVKYHGYVENIKPFWEQASVFIVPLFYGSGIRIKILEARANRIPVVSTSVGADGLPADIKKNLTIADSKEEFINCIKKLLS